MDPFQQVIHTDPDDITLATIDNKINILHQMLINMSKGMPPQYATKEESMIFDGIRDFPLLNLKALIEFEQKVTDDEVYKNAVVSVQ